MRYKGISGKIDSYYIHELKRFKRLFWFMLILNWLQMGFYITLLITLKD